MQIYLDSVGCRLNWSEVELLARQLTAAKHNIETSPQQADIIIVNTCAVTAQAERKTRRRIRSLHRDNPDAQIALVGCYATLRPEISARFLGVSWVIPNPEKVHAAQIVTGEPASSLSVPFHSGDQEDTLRTRAFIKAQDGCDHHCTYCVVRSLRGASRSRPVADITAEINCLTDSIGCREAVLTGASLGAYGRDLRQSQDLHTLVRTILSDTDIPRLRLSSVEPWDMDKAFFELWEDPRLCRQIHLPLQAGSNETLRRMGRPIRVERFRELTETARSTIPGLALTTDVLVGFPGEDERAFQESIQFIREMAFAKTHVFPYSERPGTPASRLPGQVPQNVRDERAQQVRALGASQRQRFERRFLNHQLDVLWEKQWQDGRWVGWTDNYIRVVAQSNEGLGNRIVPARLLAIGNGYVTGEVMS